jgi:hypothetical protein
MAEVYVRIDDALVSRQVAVDDVQAGQTPPA